jgi:hypothetical protein
VRRRAFALAAPPRPAPVSSWLDADEHEGILDVRVPLATEGRG